MDGLKVERVEAVLDDQLRGDRHRHREAGDELVLAREAPQDEGYVGAFVVGQPGEDHSADRERLVLVDVVVAASCRSETDPARVERANDRLAFERSTDAEVRAAVRAHGVEDTDLAGAANREQTALDGERSYALHQLSVEGDLIPAAAHPCRSKLRSRIPASSSR